MGKKKKKLTLERLSGLIEKPGKSPTIWVETQYQKEAQQYGQRKVSGLIEKPLNLNGRNNDSQVHKVNKWALRKANGPKGAKREKQSTHGHYVMQKSKNGPQQAQSNEVRK